MNNKKIYKHYYAESQRIASKLGGGWANALVDPLNDHLPETPNFYYNELNSKLEVGLGKRAECVGMDPNYVFVQDGFTAIDDQYGVSDPEVNQYFYHPDHLGSSSFITNASGNVDQHLQYLPFGEPWIDQRTSNNIRFTFSGKERDDETGYNYFGARYYNSDISIWLSVDPLSDKFSSLTPYHYVTNNPLTTIDPDGRDTTHADNATKHEVNNVYNSIVSGINKADKLSNRLEEKGLRKGWSDRMQKNYSNALERTCELSELKGYFDDMISDETMTYHFFSDNSLMVYPPGTTSFNEEKNRVEITFARGRHGTMVHEARHGVGFRKEWSWANGGKTYVDYNDEYEGYRAGNIFDHHIRGASRLSHRDLVDRVLKGGGVNLPVWNQILVP